MIQKTLSRALPPLKIEYAGEEHSLLLRPIDVTDCAQIRIAIAESGAHLKRFMTWAHQSPTFEESVSFFAQWRADYFSARSFNLGVFEQDGGDLLGVIGLIPGDRLNTNCWEVGYWISKRHAKKGIGKCALKTVILLSFFCLEVDRLEVTCSLENDASRALIASCGFVCEGELRNYLQRPSEEMVKGGLSQERGVSAFSMIPQDCALLPWVEATAAQVCLTPLQGAPVLLSEMLL